MEFFSFAKFVVPDLVKGNIRVFEGFLTFCRLYEARKTRIDHSMEICRFGCTIAGLGAKGDVIALTCLKAGNLKNDSVRYCGLF